MKYNTQNDTKERSDRLMNYFLGAYFIAGLFFASMYGTWLIAIGVGGTCLLAYYSVKLALPDSDLYQYVLSAVLALFMAQYIYQLHGLFEMHFFAFIGCAVLITYQNWKLQIPLLIFVTLHHAIFNYLQYRGDTDIYFSRLGYLDPQTFVIHILLTAVIVFICGLWAYQLKQSGEIQIAQTVQMASLQREAEILTERKRNADEIEAAWIKAEIARQEAEKAREEAERANRAKRIFLATMSH